MLRGVFEVSSELGVGETDEMDRPRGVAERKLGAKTGKGFYEHGS